MNKKKVLVLGSLAFDYIMGFKENFINAVSVDHEKEEYQSSITADSRTQYFGGTAGNIAYNLGLLNITGVSLLGSVGKDFESLGYKDHINQFDNIELGVDIYEEHFTAACYIVNDIKLNQMIIFHGGALDKSKEINLKEKLKDPGNYSYAINSCQSVDAMNHFAEELYKLKIPIIFDPGQVTPLFSKELLINVIQKSDILIGNMYEIRQIINKTELNIDEIIKIINTIIITKGSEGSELIYKDEKEKVFKMNIPIAPPNTLEDTTGAGDGYKAGILSGLTLKMTLLDSCRLGAVIGSFVVETSGAQTQRFDISKVRKRFFKVFGFVPPELEKI